MDERSLEFFDDLRKRHFPPERNFLRAHLTLFHSLPADELEAVSDYLRKLAARTSDLELNFVKWRSLGRGVAMNVESSGLDAIRGHIALRWNAVLTAQDRQPFRPHITIQNKAEPSAARQLLTSLETQPSPVAGKAVGLDLWRYLGGPWELISSHDFRTLRVALS